MRLVYVPGCSLSQRKDLTQEASVTSSDALAFCAAQSQILAERHLPSGCALRRALRMKYLVSAVLRRLSIVLRSLRTGILESHQKRKLRRMLKRVGSIRYLEKGIRADRPTTERLLIAMGARRTGSDEWTLK